MKSFNKIIYKFKDNGIDFLLIISYVVSFIPQISFVSIIVLSANFLFLKRRIKASILFFNVAILSSLIYFAYLKPKTEKFEEEVFFKGFHSNWENAAVKKLNRYNNKIINYKNENDTLPSQLEDIQNGYMDFEDISFVTYFEKHKIMEFAQFRYELINSNSYELYGIGPDGQPKTNDDLLPEIEITDTSNTELKRYRILEKQSH